MLPCRIGPSVVASYALRPARLEDARSLEAIDASVNARPWNEGQFAAACTGTAGQRETVLVVHQCDNVDGFIVYSRVLDEVSVHNIAVRASRQGQGLGQLLLKGSLEQMKQAGAARCLLEVRQSNTAALRLYEGNGFEMDGQRKNYYPGSGGRENALLMSKTL
jgi:ribosomal-protein-alanine N-acetyltransferase